MLEYSIERLETLSDEHIKEIADLCAKAYTGSLAYTTLIGGDWNLNLEYCNAFLRATVLEGELYILSISKGGKREIASFAALFPPGRAIFATEAQRALGFNNFFKKVKPEVQDWMTTVYPESVEKLKNKVLTQEERKLNWWCNNLATRPDLQGQGYGTALMNIAYQKAKKTKELGTFLGLMTITDENVSKYISMGFKDLGEIDVPVPGGNLSVHVMTRRP
ncbi:hypothetical protein BYT27DRAFT_7190678 [Phlegmacium glaucopus]|nr:hypothetical protein BYT27DRAFT_7190678 [Phlegmacium glaucopus]